MPFFFIQLSDPQFGLFAVREAAPGDGSFPETELYEKAIAAANRLKPAFVVITGDLVQDSDNDVQHTELMRITGLLDDDVPIYFTTGNCDVGNTPTPESLRIYREKFGHENYSFDAEGSHFVALNSSVCLNPSEVPYEWDSLVEFLRSDLNAHSPGSNHSMVFMHHPLFGKAADEPDDGIAIIPRERRSVILDLLRKHRASDLGTGSGRQRFDAAEPHLQCPRWNLPRGRRHSLRQPGGRPGVRRKQSLPGLERVVQRKLLLVRAGGG